MEPLFVFPPVSTVSCPECGWCSIRVGAQSQTLRWQHEALAAHTRTRHGGPQAVDGEPRTQQR
jgi:hypothetical protein